MAKKGSSKDTQIKNILDRCKKENIEFVKFQFTDILGVLKSFAVPVAELEMGMDEGMGFDGSSIMGYTPIHESDMIAMPDLSTFQVMPWRTGEGQGKVARLICDVLKPDGKPFEGDPRWVLKKNLEEAAKKGFTMNVGPELEFFTFKSMESPETTDIGGYFDLLPLDEAENLRRDIISNLTQMGIRVEYSHHEVAPSQHEIDLRYNEALAMADDAQTYKLVVKATSRQHGLYSTFMPKPLFGENGSGMHTHQSLFYTKNGKNAFYDKDDPEGWYLSDIAKSYIAGCLKYARQITLALAQWVNSYKRLVPGYEAPVYVSWARRNRSAMVRVPLYKPGKEKATRIEYRCPDPAANPYLAFSAMLAAGMAGIEEKLELRRPTEKDIFEMSPAQRRREGIKELPGNLGEAIAEFEKSKLMKEAFGEHVFENLIEIKKAEWDDYRVQVHQWELDRYYKWL
jgi:glutamine synthetase